jgi:hypothetical protein
MTVRLGITNIDPYVSTRLAKVRAAVQRYDRGR